MRLLHRNGQGHLRSEQFIRPEEVPPYAILSHTWGPDEVTFEDIEKMRYKSKDGYKKIDFCLKQAARDGLVYCWVDTCCIDKPNSTELTEALNSMFSWYQKAVKCYVFLADVPKENFRSSRWFTRGWTLQELLAPRTLEFFSSTGKKLGDKESLLQDIHERTQIPIAALQGRALSEFTIPERMSWMKGRQTTCEVDMVYSLLGIFGVWLPLIYGEPRENAERRLRKEIEENQKSQKAMVDQALRLPFALPNAPVITSSFVGRKDDIVQIQQALPFSNRRETAILHGLGGMGKTQLAIEYAQTKQGDYKAILWMDGRDETSLQKSYMTAASRLSRIYPSLPALKLAAESKNTSDATKAVLDWLNETGNDRWLLIIDNVDDPHIPDKVEGCYDVRQYLPETLHGHVIITTRSSQLQIGRQIKLNKISNASECLEILSNTAQRPEIRDDPMAIRLIKRLDGLPLALSSAGAYLYQTSDSPAQYLEQYERFWLELQQSVPGLPEHQGRTLHTTWELSRQQVERRSPEAAQLLELWAFFASQDVWYEMLRSGRDEAPEWFLNVTASKISFTKHMRVLCDYGLVETQREPAGYGLHSCVHDWVRQVLGSNERDERGRDRENSRDEKSGLAIRCISLAIPYDNEIEYWIPQRRLLSHADYWLKQDEPRGHRVNLSEYMDHLGALYQDQGRLPEAEQMYQRALEGCEKALGPEHTSTLDTVNNLGVGFHC